MRIFRPEIETALKIMGIAALISLILLPVTWGYEQRQQARNWLNIACAYRIKEVARKTPMMSTVDHWGDACFTLVTLGFALDLPREMSQRWELHLSEPS